MTSGSMAVRGMLLSALCLWSVGSLANDTIRTRMGAIDLNFPISALGNILSGDDALSRFYRERNYTLAWSHAADRLALLKTIAAAERHGLAPADYNLGQLERVATRDTSELDAEAQADIDLLLTDSALLLASHLRHGKVNAESLHPEPSADHPDRNIENLLTRALESGDVGVALSRLAPSDPGYQQLLDARAFMAALMGTPWQSIGEGTTIRPGGVDMRLTLIRQRLSALGDHAVVDDHRARVGIPRYDPELVQAVQRFQARHGLDDDGLIGRDTLAALNLTPSERLARIDANLERWRWLPDTPGDTHIVVNIAGFELTMIRNGEVVLRTRVIVGRPYRPTPLFSDSIRHLVFNPSWTVPRSIMIEDQLPIIRQNPGYLRNLGFSLYRGWGPDREPVDPDSVDWWALSEDYFPFQLIQEPGPSNALGQVKFMFPNEFDVYLHDTPARHLFSRSRRSFSSGCIRVENSLELARQLLKHQNGWSPNRLSSVLDSRELTTVHLQTPVPVHLEYWTAWVDEAGTLQLRDDIYQRNGAVIAALETAAGYDDRIHQASAN